MAGRSSIEWTDATWNPVRGCVKVSPGCKHCYAETFAERWRGIACHPYEQGFDPRLVPEKLGEPLTWRKPRKVFVNSMSDLFGDFVPDEYVAAVFGVMAATPHIWQVLTKRAERLPRWFEWASTYHLIPDAVCPASGHPMPPLDPHVVVTECANARTNGAVAIARGPWPLPNVWLGVSVEDRKYGVPRIEHLRQVPAVVRFLSIEPLLEDLGELDLRGIHWVIVGGESGPGARPMEAAWVRSLRDQCEAAGVPFFFKQWGGVLKKKTGRVLDGRTYDGFPEVRHA